MEEELEAGITKVTSSAYLRAELPGVTHIRSVELRMNRTGPRAEPCTTLALMGRGGETEEQKRVMWERSVKKSMNQK